MNRKGFTLLELLIVVIFVAVLAALAIPVINAISGGTDPSGQNYYDIKNSGKYQCIKTYVMNVGEGSSKRVDLLPAGGGAVVTMTCDDDVWNGQNNSATLFAQFKEDQWYNVSSVGFRQEGGGFTMTLFPNVTSVSITTGE